MYRKDVILAIGAVEKEFRAAALGVGRLMRQAADDPTTLGAANVSHADVRMCSQHLEDTYLVRMFAVYEAVRFGCAIPPARRTHRDTW